MRKTKKNWIPFVSRLIPRVLHDKTHNNIHAIVIIIMFITFFFFTRLHSNYCGYRNAYSRNTHFLRFHIQNHINFIFDFAR